MDKICDQENRLFHYRPGIDLVVKEKVLAYTKSLLARLNSMKLAELSKSKKVFMGLLDEKE